MFAKLVSRAWNNPWLLLSLCVLFWASNVVAARIAPGEISPIFLGGSRWIVACAIMLPMVWQPMIKQREVIARHWLFILLAAGAGSSRSESLDMALRNSAIPLPNSPPRLAIRPDPNNTTTITRMIISSVGQMSIVVFPPKVYDYGDGTPILAFGDVPS